MCFASASKANKEKTMKTMMKKLWRLGIVCLVTVNLIQISPALAGGPPEAAANNFRGRVEVTFLKWIPDFSGSMAGVVSGDVGGGTFVGETLSFSQTDAIATIEALYHINGKTLQFTAHNYITFDTQKGTAVIKGFVPDGVLKGARVNGEFQAISPCGIINAQNGAFGDTCFQGNLVIRPGSEN
jgi:hypothetical protein